MSKQASPPDGTDPRVLQPEGVDVVMGSASRQSSTQRYHKPGCKEIEEMISSPKTKDIAVAKWKGMEPCATCHGPRHDCNGGGLAVEGPDVDRWRRDLVEGDKSLGDIGSAAPKARATIGKHVRGDIDAHYETPPETRPVWFDRHGGYTWRWTEGE